MESILFISDNSDASNWGCYATSKELRILINDTYQIQQSIFLNDLKHTHRKFNTPTIADIKYVLSEYKNIVGGSGSIPRRLYTYGIKTNMHFWDFIPKTAEQFEPKSEQFLKSGEFDRLLSAVEDVDHVIINGEGSIHGNRHKSQILLFLAYVTKAKFNIPTHIVNHTLQIDTPRLHRMVDLVYPTLDTIVFRDPISVEQYNSKIGEGNIVTAADAAWLFDDFISKTDLNKLFQSGGLSLWSPGSDSQVDFNNKYVCVGGGSGFNRGDEKIAKGFETLVHRLKTEIPDYNILLTAAAGSDETFMLKVSERTGVPLIKLNNDVRVAASVISNSDLYVGGRWHPTIFALLGNSQIVSFQGNTFKMDSIKKQLNTTHPVYQTSKLYNSVDEVINAVETGVHSGFERVPMSESKINQFRNDAKKNITSICKRGSHV